MSSVVRPATQSDLTQITAIYNHYVLTTPITFDLEPVTPEQRVPWFHEHTEGPRYKLFVAEDDGHILGYAGTGRFRNKAAYDTTAEVTIYCAPDVVRRGIGRMLYQALFDSLRDADLHRFVAGITIPNEASLKIHRGFGFKEVGVFTQVGRKFDRYWDVLWMERPAGAGSF